MEKRIRSLTTLISILFLVAVPAMVPAATFTYYASSLFSQSGALVYNVGGSESDDPGADTSWDHEEVNSSQYASYDDGNYQVEASGNGFGSAETYDNQLSIRVEGSVDGMSNDGNGHMESYGGASMVQPGETAGIFFEITPGVGENIGDPVRIDFSWMRDLGTSEGTWGHLSGGWGGDTIAITLNDYPSSDPLANVVWSHDRVDRFGGDGFLDGEDGFFMAAIGDVIGIHMDAGVNLEWDGEGYELWASASQDLTMEANPAVPVPGAFWLLGSGLFGLVAVRRRQKES